MHHNSPVYDPGPSGGSLAEPPALFAMSDDRAQAAAIRDRPNCAPSPNMSNNNRASSHLGELSVASLYSIP